MGTRHPRTGHGGREISPGVITRVPPALGPAAHTRIDRTRPHDRSGAVVPAAHAKTVPGATARGAAHTTNGAVQNSRKRGTMRTPGTGQRRTGTVPGVRHGLATHGRKRHNPTRGGGHALSPGRTLALARATRPLSQALPLHGAARRQGGWRRADSSDGNSSDPIHPIRGSGETRPDELDRMG